MRYKSQKVYLLRIAWHQTLNILQTAKVLLRYKAMNNISKNLIMIKTKLFLSYILLATSLFIACKQKSQQAANVQSRAYYTCSMHPQIHEEHPGNCPVCGMKLIKVELTGAVSKTLDNITLTATQLQLANIQTDTVLEENT